MAITGKIVTLLNNGKAVLPRTSASAITDLLDSIYPVGSIYMSVTYHHPTDMFGGTWELISGRFLVGHGSNGVDLEVLAGDTGGEASHTLTVDEMPQHSHKGIKWLSSTGASFGVNDSGDATLRFSYNGGSSADALYTGREGGSQPHNNLPPYLAVYIWKRTA